VTSSSPVTSAFFSAALHWLPIGDPTVLGIAALLPRNIMPRPMVWFRKIFDAWAQADDHGYYVLHVPAFAAASGTDTIALADVGCRYAAISCAASKSLSLSLLLSVDHQCFVGTELA